MNTKEIYEELSKFVVGQDEYIKQLAILSYKHQLKQKQIEKGLTPINTNMLVIGPSGCGKTFAARKLASLIDVPFYEIDCSNLVQVGYKGNTSIEDSLSRLVNENKHNYNKAIIYLDEFDKILDLALLKDGKGTGSQQNFLKILEPGKATITTGYRFESKLEIDTSGFTFIATGSFESVKREIKLNNNVTMGFNVERKIFEDINLSKRDLIEYGYMAELMGRFPTFININQLSEDDFVSILKNSEDSVYKRYVELFKQDNISFNINDSAFRNIVEQSYSNVIGARSMDETISKIADQCLYDASYDTSIVSIDVSGTKNGYKFKYRFGELRNYKDSDDTVGYLLVNELKKEMNEYIEEMDTMVRYENSLRKEIDSIFSGGSDVIKVADYIYELKMMLNIDVNENFRGVRNEFYDHFINKYINIKQESEKESNNGK